MATCVYAAAFDPVRAWPDGIGDWSWALLILGAVGTVVFGLLDLSLFALSPEEIEDLSHFRPRTARILHRLHANLDRTWITLLTGRLLSGFLVGFMTIAMLSGRATFPMSSGFVLSLERDVLPIVAALVLLLLCGEVAPGLIAARWLKPVAPWAARGLRVAEYALSPFVALPLAVLRVAEWFVDDARIDAFRRTLSVEKRLLVLVGLGEVDVDVTFEEEEREMIDQALEFGQSQARNLMRPRDAIVGFDTETSQEEVLTLMRQTPVHRVLVFEETMDKVVGIVHTKQVLLNTDEDYHRFIATPLFVEEEMDLIDLMARMRAEHCHLAVVLDTYGATAGVIAMDDLFDALVGKSGDKIEDGEDA
jgi:putative hemolysin